MVEADNINTPERFILSVCVVIIVNYSEDDTFWNISLTWQLSNMHSACVNGAVDQETMHKNGN